MRHDDAGQLHAQGHCLSSLGRAQAIDVRGVDGRRRVRVSVGEEWWRDEGHGYGRMYPSHEAWEPLRVESLGKVR